MDGREHAQTCSYGINFRFQIPKPFCNFMYEIPCVWPSPRIPVASEGLGWDPVLKMQGHPHLYCSKEGHTQEIPSVELSRLVSIDYCDCHVRVSLVTFIKTLDMI